MPVEFIQITPGKTVSVRITGATRIQGQHVEEERVVIVSEEVARELVIAQKAVIYVEPAAEPEPEPEPEPATAKRK